MCERSMTRCDHGISCIDSTDQVRGVFRLNQAALVCSDIAPMGLYVRYGALVILDQPSVLLVCQPTSRLCQGGRFDRVLLTWDSLCGARRIKPFHNRRADL